MIDVYEKDLRTATTALLVTAAALKRRFPNLTVNETNEIAREIVYAIHGATASRPAAGEEK